MKNTFRRLMGTLLALMMIFSSVNVPVSGLFSARASEEETDEEQRLNLTLLQDVFLLWQALDQSAETAGTEEELQVMLFQLSARERVELENLKSGTKKIVTDQATGELSLVDALDLDALGEGGGDRNESFIPTFTDPESQNENQNDFTDPDDFEELSDLDALDDLDDIDDDDLDDLEDIDDDDDLDDLEDIDDDDDLDDLEDIDDDDDLDDLKDIGDDDNLDDIDEDEDNLVDGDDDDQDDIEDEDDPDDGDDIDDEDMDDEGDPDGEDDSDDDDDTLDDDDSEDEVADDSDDAGNAEEEDLKVVDQNGEGDAADTILVEGLNKAEGTPKLMMKQSMSRMNGQALMEGGTTLLAAGESDPEPAPTPTTYEVKYQYDTSVPEGASAPAGGNYEEGATVTVATPTAIDGYKFNGWTVTSPAALDISDGSFTMPGEGVELTGSWTKLYTVTYSYTNAPTGAPAVPASQSYAAGTEVSVSGNVSLADYVFSGWQVDGATAADGKFTMPAANVTITGSWTPVVKASISNTESSGTYTLEDEGAKEWSSALTVKYFVGGVESALPEGLTATISAENDIATISGNTATITKSAAGTYQDTIKVTLSGSTAGFVLDSTTEYTATLKLTIEKAASLTVTPASYSGQYDGASHAGSATVKDGTKEITGATIYYRIKEENGWGGWSENAPAIKDVGTVIYQVKAEAANYVTVEPADTDTGTTLEVTKREITIKTGTAEKVYDGTPLTSSDYSIIRTGNAEGDAIVSGESLTVTPDGTITIVGEADNTYTPTWGDGTDEDNYNITDDLGKLTVTKAGVTAAWANNSDTLTKIYDRNNWTSHIDVDTDLKINVTSENVDNMVKGTDYTITVPDDITTAGTYDITVKLSENFKFTDNTDTKILKFTVSPAKITSAELTYTKVGFNRTDWSKRINTDKTENAYTDYPNTLTIKTENDLELSENRNEFKLNIGSGWINEGSYDVSWSLSDTTNFAFADGERISDYTPQIMIQPAIVENEATITYKTGAVYDRTNWRDYIHAAKVTPAVSDSIHKDNEVNAQAKWLLPDGGYGEFTLNVPVSGDLNGSTSYAELELTDSAELIDAGSYTGKITWGITSGQSANFAVKSGLNQTIDFEIAKAEISTYQLEYDKVTYNRKNWAKNIYVNGGDEPDSTPTNKITATAVAKKTDALLADQTLELTGTDFMSVTIDGTELASADVTIVKTTDDGKYTVTTEISDNFAVKKDDDTTVQTFERPFTVVPAVVSEYKLAYNAVTYDRHDWSKEIYLTGETKDSANKNLVTVTTKGAAGTYNEEDATNNPLTLDKSLRDYELAETLPAMLDAGTYTSKFKISTNFEVSGTPAGTFTLDLTVNPAVIEKSSLTYAVTRYDRHDWADNVKTKDEAASTDDPDNYITITTKEVTQPGGDKVILTLNEDSDFLPEYSIGTLPDMTEVGDYIVPWILEDTANFVFEDDDSEAELRNKAFKVEKAEIETVTIQRDDGASAATSATVVYDAQDWIDRIGINGAGGVHHSFEVVATTQEYTIPGTSFVVDPYIVNTDEISLSYPNPDSDDMLCQVGNYFVEVDIDDQDNFKYLSSIALDSWNDDEYDVLLPFEITPHPVNNIVFDPSNGNNFDPVYYFGGKSLSGGGDTVNEINISFEPGEEVLLTATGSTGSITIIGAAAADRFSNYPVVKTPMSVMTIKMTATAEGLLIEPKDSSVATGSILVTSRRSAAEGGWAFTLQAAYTDSTNLTQNGEADTRPEEPTLQIIFDNEPADISGAVSPLTNRADNYTFVAPEDGYVEATLVTRDSTRAEARQDIAKDTGRVMFDGWKAAQPELTRSGDSLTVTFVDRAGNETTYTYGIAQDSGASLTVEFNPEKRRLDRLDHTQMVANQIMVEITGTAYEDVRVSFSGHPSLDQMVRLSDSGSSWSASTTGTAQVVVNAGNFRRDESVIVTVHYDDLTNSENDTFIYDDMADDILLTTGDIVAEEFSTISGIMERESTLAVEINGVKYNAVSSDKRERFIQYDSYGVFTVKLPLLSEGDEVVLKAVDPAGNVTNNSRQKVLAPAYTKTFDFYAMGKVFRDNTYKSNDSILDGPSDYVMASYLTREELQNGVTLHLVAANAFSIGTITLTMPADGSEPVIKADAPAGLAQPYVGYLSADDGKNLDATPFLNKTPSSWADVKDSKAFWVCVKGQVEMNSMEATDSFQLADAGKNAIRDEYLNRQKNEPLSKLGK